MPHFRDLADKNARFPLTATVLTAGFAVDGAWHGICQRSRARQTHGGGATAAVDCSWIMHEVVPAEPSLGFLRKSEGECDARPSRGL